MSRHPRYGASKKPIRKDRVAIAVVIVAAIILIPILLRSGCTRRGSEPLTVIEETTGEETALLPGVTAPGDETPEETTPEGTSAPTTYLEGILTHTVEDGETQEASAAALGVSLKNLRASNRLYAGETLQPGQVLVASPEGVLHVIKRGQTLTDIAVTYAVPKETIAEANGISVNRTSFAGDRLLIPTMADTY